MVTEVLAGHVEHVCHCAQQTGLAENLLTNALRHTLFSTLSHIAAALAPLRSRVRWPHGYCPTCGSRPLLAEFRGLEQTWFLRCEVCATDWEFPHLQCPYCSTQDHRQLGYFRVSGEEEKYRAVICDQCCGYVKTASTLAALPRPALLVMDLATIHLDLAAADRGYARPW